MPSVNLKEFLALQLNDSVYSRSGIECESFFHWSEQHIEQALNLALCYVYSLIPDKFASLQTYEVPKESCVIDLSSVCSRLIDIISLDIGNGDCIELSSKESMYKTNSLVGLLKTSCINGDEIVVEEDNDYGFVIKSSSASLVRFNDPIPKRSIISFLCASPPEISSLSSGNLCEYYPLIADHALWWLYRSDSESKSNLDRARLHFESMRSFVQTKLLIEFSLTEDDYNFGQQKIYDNKEVDD